MRRFAISFAIFGIALSACAAPPLRLSSRYVVGDVRTYRLTVEARTTIETGSVDRDERTTLEARSTIEVIGTQGEETTVRVTLTPERFVRRGARAVLPPEQRAELVLAPDGTVRRIAAIGGVPVEIAGVDVDDLAPVLTNPLPTARVHLGERWRRTIVAPSPGGADGAPPRGEERGRVSALRVVRGYDCAIVSLSARRPIVRERALAGQAVRLSGTELSKGEIAFAFRDGFAVEVARTADARLAVQAGGFTGGTVTIATETRLVLIAAAPRNLWRR